MLKVTAVSLSNTHPIELRAAIIKELPDALVL